MKNLQFHYYMDIEFSEPVYNHTYTLKCIPKTTDTQEITECTANICPENKVQRGVDSFGNITLYGNVEENHRVFSVNVRGTAKTGLLNQPLSNRDTDTAIYRYQTPLTMPGKRIRGLHQQLSGKEAMPLSERVRYYMDAVYESMNYRKGMTDINTTAEDALNLGSGVCQDFTHILLSLCREDKIPARYVVGMLLGEGESHAWAEVFDGKGWIGFDPTNNAVVHDSHIKISHGRDYQDCSINRGVFTGQSRQKQRIFVEVTEEGHE